MAENLGRYNMMEKISSGSFGEVYLSEDQETGNMVAVKRIRINLEGYGIPHLLLREVSILRSLSHANIIYLQECILISDFAFCIFDFMDMDLRHFLVSSLCNSEEQAKEIARQILEGLKYIHSRKVIHRDLKPENILINHTGQVKLTDFGISRYYEANRPFTAEVQSLWYRAPEVLAHQAYSFEIDIWSVGCIIAELLNGQVLFNGISEYEQAFKIFSTLGPPPHAKQFEHIVQTRNLRNALPRLSDDAFNLVELMLRVDPHMRITPEEALNHVYFRGN